MSRVVASKFRPRRTLPLTPALSIKVSRVCHEDRKQTRKASARKASRPSKRKQKTAKKYDDAHGSGTGSGSGPLTKPRRALTEPVSEVSEVPAETAEQQKQRAPAVFLLPQDSELPHDHAAEEKPEEGRRERSARGRADAASGLVRLRRRINL